MQLLPGYQSKVKNLVDGCPCIKKGCLSNCMNASCFLTDWDPQPGFPDIYVKEYAPNNLPSYFCLNLLRRYSKWSETPSVTPYSLCNTLYLSPPTDFYMTYENYSPRNGDLLSLLGVST
jgi:hypothetical protein